MLWKWGLGPDGERSVGPGANCEMHTCSPVKHCQVYVSLGTGGQGEPWAEGILGCQLTLEESWVELETLWNAQSASPNSLGVGPGPPSHLIRIMAGALQMGERPGGFLLPCSYMCSGLEPGRSCPASGRPCHAPPLMCCPGVPPSNLSSGFAGWFPSWATTDVG